VVTAAISPRFTLALRNAIVYDDEIVFHPGKLMRRHLRHGKIIATAKTVIVEWSPEPRAAVERARMLGPDIGKALICNLQGKPFTESGFRENWHRLIQGELNARMARNGVRRRPLSPYMIFERSL